MVYSSQVQITGTLLLTQMLTGGAIVIVEGQPLEFYKNFETLQSAGQANYNPQ